MPEPWERDTGALPEAQFWPPGARWRGIAWLAAIFVGYAGALYLSLLLAPTGVALLWLPNVVLVAALFAFRPRDWPYVYTAGLCGQMAGGLAFQGVAPHNGLYIGVVNAIEATLVVVCAALIARGRRNVGLLSIRGASALILASISVPAVTGAFGAKKLAQLFDIDFGATWLGWWLGDSLGLLVGLSTVLMFRDFNRCVVRSRPVKVIVFGLGAATFLTVVSAVMAFAGNTWAAQQIAIAAAVILALVLGGVGAAFAAAWLVFVTLIGVTHHPEGLDLLVRDQTLLFVVVAAIYAIAAATESADRALGQLSRTGNVLQSANLRLASLLEATPDALIIVGTDGRIVLANAAADRMFGYARQDLIGTDVEALLPSRLRGAHVHWRTGFFANPAQRSMGPGLPLWALRRDGTEFPVSISLSPERTGESVQVLAAIRDVTERQEHMEQLRLQRDELIDAKGLLLSERDRFASLVDETPSAISVRDLQHRYTLVNEAFCAMFGHRSPDEVIGRCESEILPSDVLVRSREAVARLINGEKHVEEESIAAGTENVSVITQRFPLRDSTGAVTELVTIRTDITHRKLIEQETAERATWQRHIAAAIDEGRLVAYSQPIVDIESKQTIAEELLVRLRPSGNAEVLPPSAFLPQCERHALMPMIDGFMVGRAIDLASAGRQVTVNISGQTIADTAAMEGILEALSRAGTAVTDRIIFEITETTAVASPAMSTAFSASMRDRGCRVALDDFGTGYGTFIELRHLALYALKIDRSFVRNLLENFDDDRVVSTIIFVAKTYGLTTIAEGVESQQVLNRLAELGVDRAQGYLFGRPTEVIAS